MEDEMISVICSDGVSVQMPEECVKMNLVLKCLAEDCGSADGTPLSEISSKTFKQIVEFSKEHVNNPCTKDNKKIDEWDLSFCQSIYDTNKVDLFKLYAGSNYIDNPQLLDVCAKFLARQIKGKTADEIRKEFNIKNDLTPEQEADIKKKNEWCLPEGEKNQDGN